MDESDDTRVMLKSGEGRWVWATVAPEGDLTVSGQILRSQGSVLEEYEWSDTVPAAAVPRLFAALGEPADAPMADVLARHGEQLAELPRLAASAGLELSSWTRYDVEDDEDGGF